MRVIRQPVIGEMDTIHNSDSEEDLDSDNSQNWTEEEVEPDGGDLLSSPPPPSSDEGETSATYESETHLQALADDLELKLKALMVTKAEVVEKLFDTKAKEEKLEPVPHFSKVYWSCGTLETVKEGAISSQEISTIQAREEISKLRDVRESLISQRGSWIPPPNVTISSEQQKYAQLKLYELEEAVEVVDTAIEMKNEVILGKSEDPPAEPQSPSELVPNLDSLSPSELKRLLSKSLTKIVELRSSSRALEKEVEHMDSSNDKLKKEVAKEHKLLEETKNDYQARIRLLFTGGNANLKVDTLLRQMDDKLAEVRKKNHDLKRSLTQLLVRHGYLVDGADYDVRQVVRTLGIEGNAPLQGGSFRARGIFSARRGTRGVSRGRWIWQRSRPSDPQQKSRTREEDKIRHELQRRRYHMEVNLAKVKEEQERRRAFVQEPPEVEVRREKRKIILQQMQPPDPGRRGRSRSHYYQHY